MEQEDKTSVKNDSGDKTAPKSYSVSSASSPGKNQTLQSAVTKAKELQSKAPVYKKPALFAVSIIVISLLSGLSGGWIESAWQW